MAKNKIVYNGTTLIDLTGDDVIESDVAQGKIFHKADGTQAIGTASGGGDTLYDAYTSNDFEYSNSEITAVPAYMCYNSKVKRLDLPNITSVGNYAFYGCTGLTTVSLPSCTTIGQYAFYNCKNITTIYLPAVTEVQSRGLAGTITGAQARTASLPECITLGIYAMQGTALTSVSIPKIQSIGTNQWENCSYLESLTLPASFNGVVPFSMCAKCSALEEVIFEGNVVSVASSAFNNCTACLVYDFSHCTGIPTLENVNAFNGINENAQIKVPAALEEDWKWAQRWYQLESHIVGV